MTVVVRAAQIIDDYFAKHFTMPLSDIATAQGQDYIKPRSGSSRSTPFQDTGFHARSPARRSLAAMATVQARRRRVDKACAPRARKASAARQVFAGDVPGTALRQQQNHPGLPVPRPARCGSSLASSGPFVRVSSG